MRHTDDHMVGGDRLTLPADDELAVAHATALSALLQRVGYAVWQLAECEDALAHWVVIALRSTQGIGDEAAEPIVSKAQRRTFGQLMSELRDAEILDPELVRRIEALVQERNWLVYHAKRENRGVLNDPDRFDSLVARITEIADEATALQGTLGSELEEYVVRKGVDRRRIDEEAAQIISDWGY